MNLSQVSGGVHLPPIHSAPRWTGGAGRAVAPSPAGPACGFADGFADGPADGLAGGLADGRSARFAGGLADGLAGGLTGGLVDGLAGGLTGGLVDGLAGRVAVMPCSFSCGPSGLSRLPHVLGTGVRPGSAGP
ncbi:hypothetical protein GCM10014719_15300 [Planomonospora parontospora subsp. antibiotica]|nr:hypothetical protein GCM10014719_15300 [Planomonospora parontospora subsp. antibiotica]GII17854.1 hypothetical protein Ppa05_45800 [Planomonospora parontospora subsp. antibiotica]